MEFVLRPVNSPGMNALLRQNAVQDAKEVDKHSASVVGDVVKNIIGREENLRKYVSILVRWLSIPAMMERDI